MEFFNPKSLKIDFVRWMSPMGWLSVALTVGSLILLVKPGMNFGIDFEGGVQMELVSQNPEITESSLREMFNQKLENFSVQGSQDGGQQSFLLTAKVAEGQDASSVVKEGLAAKFATDTWNVSKVDLVGPRVGKELKISAILSIIYTCLLIGMYVWWRFDIRYAPGALICILHDLIVTAGFLAITQIEFSTTLVAALLTLAGYSVNDTVVVFDRIRELEGRLLGKSREAVVNEAVNSTLGRTTLTSLTTFFSCGVLYFLAGPTLQDFALTLAFGIIVGTYSSIYVSATTFMAISRYQDSKGSQPAQA